MTAPGSVCDRLHWRRLVDSLKLEHDVFITPALGRHTLALGEALYIVGEKSKRRCGSTCERCRWRASYGLGLDPLTTRWSSFLAVDFVEPAQAQSAADSLE